MSRRANQWVYIEILTSSIIVVNKFWVRHSEILGVIKHAIRLSLL